LRNGNLPDRSKREGITKDFIEYTVNIVTYHPENTTMIASDEKLKRFEWNIRIVFPE